MILDKRALAAARREIALIVDPHAFMSGDGEDELVKEIVHQSRADALRKADRIIAHLNLSALPSGIPAGFKLVPVEPTADHLLAILRGWYTDYDPDLQSPPVLEYHHEKARQTYHSLLLAASPSPPASPSAEGRRDVLHDDTHPIHAGLHRMVVDGGLPDDYRRTAKAAYDALPATPVADTEPVRVKALEWQYILPKLWGVDTALSSYRIHEHSDGQYGVSVDGDALGVIYPSLGEAKSAAQADYDTRIRSALVSPDGREGGERGKVDPATVEACAKVLRTMRSNTGDFVTREDAAAAIRSLVETR